MGRVLGLLAGASAAARRPILADYAARTMLHGMRAETRRSGSNLTRT